ncbi:WxL domain-containing protein [Lactococcus formosensis]|uniref:WxL domain-containing protein n=1 Tax=Lactococcus formosensis TaxID=1281486 RepID=UPI002435E622|nr:WxL domain-containing protein [Lactococcus formosensis]MDG6120234.1 WxL domain-containing protein [Lactococcus formosensis]
MKSNKFMKISSVAALALVFGGIYTPASAKETEQPANSIADAKTVIATDIVGGEVTLDSFAPSFTFEFNLKDAWTGVKSLKKLDVSAGASEGKDKFSGQITDLRGVDSKWKLVASLDKFLESGNKDSINSSNISFKLNGKVKTLLPDGQSQEMLTGGGEGALDTSVDVADTKMEIVVEHAHNHVYTSSINWELQDTPAE